MAIGDAYATLAQLRAHADIFDRHNDDELTRVASAVSRAVEQFTGRQFNKETSATARTYHPKDAHTVRVDDFHTDTDLAVTMDTANDGSYSYTVPAGQYWLEPHNGVVAGRTGYPYTHIRRRSGTFIVNGLPTVQVTAQWGWDAVPDDVVQAVLIQSARIFGRKYSVNGVIGAGDFAFRVSTRMDPDVEDLLQPYVAKVLVR